MTESHRNLETDHDSLHDAFAAVARQVDPGAQLVRYRALTGGVSAQVHILELTRSADDPRNGDLRNDDPKHIVVRRPGSDSWKDLKEDVVTTEFRVLTALFGAGLPVPEPLLLDTSCRLLPSPFLAMSWIDGSTAGAADDFQITLPKMADFLVDLHRLDLSSLHLPALPRREDPIRGALEYLPSDLQLSPLRDAIRCHRRHPNQDCLLHGDFWPGNLLWQGADLVAVIDWEDVAVGCPLSDLACCRSELHAIFGPAAMQRFTECYLQSRRLQVFDLPLWDMYVGSAALATMHHWGLPDEVEAMRRERTSSFVERAARELLRRPCESGVGRPQ